MEFVRWATGADEPRPWPVQALAWLILVLMVVLGVLRGRQ